MIVLGKRNVQNVEIYIDGEKKTKQKIAHKNHIAHMNTDTNPRLRAQIFYLQHVSLYSFTVWLWDSSCGCIQSDIGKNRRNSIKFFVSFSFLTIYTLHFWASVKKRRTIEAQSERERSPCRNCAIKRSKVSAHIFNTHILAHSITQIINSHSKRYFTSPSLSLFAVWLCFIWILVCAMLPMDTLFFIWLFWMYVCM